MEALLYEKLKNNIVRCKLCNHFCLISKGKKGICAVRENKDGTLYSLNYGLSISTSIDPIEKKPLYHFLPNTWTYSFASVGCNMDCPWCQNHTISQSPKQHNKIAGVEIKPKTHIENALKFNCPSISYTYSEPTIYLEYALEVMKLAKEAGLKNIWVTNGFMSKECLELIIPYIDALNIDYKGNENTYQSYCTGSSKPVLENIKILKEHNIHIEITTLLIPGINTDSIIEIANDLLLYAGVDTPWHISRFFPSFKMTHVNPTPKETMYKAKEVAKKLGFKYIYLGNI